MKDNEYDLQDYTEYLRAEAWENFEAFLKEINEEELKSLEQSRHPLAQFTQPYDWCAVLQYTD